MYKHRLILLLGCVWNALVVWSMVPIVSPYLGVPTGITPAYFGPNAFPVPDMLDGRVQNHLRVEIA